MRVLWTLLAFISFLGCARRAVNAHPVPTSGAPAACSPLRLALPGELIVFPEPRPPGAADFENRQLSRLDMFMLLVVAQAYCSQYKEYPASLEQLARFSSRLPLTSGCSSLRETSGDPWGKRYRYELTQSGPRVRSAGSDRRWDTADDLALAGSSDPDEKPVDIPRICGPSPAVPVDPVIREGLGRVLGAAPGEEIQVDQRASLLLPGFVVYQGTRWTSLHGAPARASLLVGAGDTLLVAAPRDLAQVLPLLTPRCPAAAEVSGAFWTAVLNETALLRAGKMVRAPSELTEADRAFLRPAESLAQMRPPSRGGTTPTVLSFFVEDADGVHLVEVVESSACKGAVTVTDIARRG